MGVGEYSKQERITKLEAALVTLDAGSDVSAAKLKRLLGDDGYERFLDDWRVQQEMREDMRIKPDEIVKYEQLLGQATFTYSKADAFSAKGKNQTAQALFDNAATEFERVLEHLSENVAGHLDLEQWFDRSVHFNIDTRPSLTPANFPQVVTSRSRLNISDGKLPGMMTKRELKQATIEAALDDLNRAEPDQAAIAERLKEAQRLKRYTSD